MGDMTHLVRRDLHVALDCPQTGPSSNWTSRQDYGHPTPPTRASPCRLRMTSPTRLWTKCLSVAATVCQKTHCLSGGH